MYEFWIDIGDRLLLWEGLTREEAETLNELTVKLNPEGYMTNGWNKVEGLPAEEED